MDVYTSENEQVEAIKRWWDENGRQVVVGVIIALVAVVGWRSWQDHRADRAAEASSAYEQLLNQTEPEKVVEQGRAFLTAYGDTSYAALASLAMAGAAVEQNDLDGAAAHLRAAMESARIPGIKPVAAERLARVLLAQGNTDEALKVLDGTKPEGLTAAYAEVRGDILLSRGDRAGARNAYQEALAGYGESSPRTTPVQMKLDDLNEANG